jgi:TonB family protein
VTDRRALLAAAWIVALFAASLFVVVPRLAWAGDDVDPDAGAPVANAITPPKALDAGNVPYPDGATGEAEVVVELVIDTAGAVRTARIVEGAEPFGGAVLAAADKFTFEPARRGDVPIAARIRMKVSFHPPAPIVDGGAGANDGAALDAGAPLDAGTRPTSTAKIEDDIEDVTVFGKRKEVGQISLGGAEVRQIPGAFGDAFRALEALPGVTPLASGLPFFFVRGAPPGNTGYFIDGVRVPLLYHLAVGPSVIHPGLIDHVDFFPGGYPARFGRFAGGILSGETVGPAAKFKMEGNLRIFDAGLLAQTPFGPGNRGEALVSGRFGYPGLLLSVFAPDTRVSYWDYQTRLGYRITDRDTVALFAFGSFDEILQRDHQRSFNGDQVVGEQFGPFYPLFRTMFHRFDLRWDHRIGNSGNVRTAFTVGFDNSLAGDSQKRSDVIAQIVAGRTEMEQRLSSTAKVRVGADVWWSSYRVEAGGQIANAGEENISFPTKTDVNFAVRGDVIWRVHPRIEVVPGLRIDYFSTIPQFNLGPLKSSGAAGTISFDPRAASRVTITKDFALLTTFGVAHQPPSTAIPIPGLDIGTLAEGLQSSLQASQGIEVKLPLDFTLTATAFVQNYFNLTDQFATCITVTGDRAENCITARVRGRGFGAELLIRRDLTKRITGWISYTLSRSTRGTNGPQVQIPNCGDFDCTFPASRDSEVLSEFDRTHVLNLVGAVDLGHGWRFSSRFYLYSGRPYTSLHLGDIPVPPYNRDRLPAFWRIDLRVEKQWKLGERGRISFVIEGLNVTFNREAFGASCPRSSTGLLQRCDEYQYLGPVAIPSIGVEGSY